MKTESQFFFISIQSLIKKKTRDVIHVLDQHQFITYMKYNDILTNPAHPVDVNDYQADFKDSIYTRKYNIVRDFGEDLVTYNQIGSEMFPAWRDDDTIGFVFHKASSLLFLLNDFFDHSFPKVRTTI